MHYDVHVEALEDEPQAKVPRRDRLAPAEQRILDPCGPSMNRARAARSCTVSPPSTGTDRARDREPALSKPRRLGFADHLEAGDRWAEKRWVAVTTADPVIA